MADQFITEDADLAGALPGGQDSKETGSPPQPEKNLEMKTVVGQDAADALDALFSKTTEPGKDGNEPDKAPDELPDKKSDKSDETPEKESDKSDKEPDKEPEKDGKEPGNDKEPEKEAPKDEFDAIELPPYSKPKSVEAFAKVKETARQRLAERDTKIADLTKQLETAKTAPNKEAEDLKKEVEELRTWRKSVDVENDPSFQEFDKKTARNVEMIYSRLSESGFTKEQIEEIKSAGGPSKIDWEPVFATKGFPAGLRRLIETKLVDNETLAVDKAAAIEAAKKNADAFLKDRNAKGEAEKKQYTETLHKSVAHYMDASWKGPALKEVPANATPEQKAQVESDNAFIKEVGELIKDLQKDDSADTRAQAIVGTAFAHLYLRQLTGANKELEATKAELKKATEELGRIKKASGASRTPSAAPQKPTKPKGDIFARGEDALDAAWAEVRGTNE